MPLDTQTPPKPIAAAFRDDDARDPIYTKIRDLVYQACGIYHSEEKLYLLAGACKRRMAANPKATDPRQYLDSLSNTSTRTVELRELLNEITIGETCLFRSQPQLTALQNVILPELIETRGKIGLKKLKIWSAGCSTGEEPYTLSMFLLEQSEKLLKGWTSISRPPISTTVRSKPPRPASTAATPSATPAISISANTSRLPKTKSCASTTRFVAASPSLASISATTAGCSS